MPMSSAAKTPKPLNPKTSDLMLYISATNIELVPTSDHHFTDISPSGPPETDLIVHSFSIYKQAGGDQLFEGIQNYVYVDGMCWGAPAAERGLIMVTNVLHLHSTSVITVKSHFVEVIGAGAMNFGQSRL